MARLEINLLGTFEIRRDSTPVTEFTSNKVRALLAYLAVEVGRPHSREALAVLLWPDSSQELALSSLRNALSNLRGAIGDRDANPPYLQITHEAVQFNPHSDLRLDAADLIRQSTIHPSPLPVCPLPVVQAWVDAVEGYRGPFLEGFSIPDSAAYEEWTSVWRERLARQVIQGLHWLSDYYEAGRNYPTALQYARRQVELDPWMEEGHCQVMRLLALSGQRQ